MEWLTRIFKSIFGGNNFTKRDVNFIQKGIKGNKGCDIKIENNFHKK